MSPTRLVILSVSLQRLIVQLLSERLTTQIPMGNLGAVGTKLFLFIIHLYLFKRSLSLKFKRSLKPDHLQGHITNLKMSDEDQSLTRQSLLCREFK